MLAVIVHAANIQDRDGGPLLLATLFGLFPFLRKLYADAGYQGPKFQAALKRVLRRVKLEIVKRSDAAKGFGDCLTFGGQAAAAKPGWVSFAGANLCPKPEQKVPL